MQVCQNLKYQIVPPLLIVPFLNDCVIILPDALFSLNRLITISLGGDNHNVLENLRIGAREGQWVCLKNLHLAIDLLPALEIELDDISENCHDNFRLWFTTEKSNLISSQLVERSFKIMCESPTGLRENVKQIFSRWEESPLAITETNTNNDKKAKLFFILAWTHAILQERGSFGPHGWRLKYDFTSGDLFAAESVIDTFHNSCNAEEIIAFFIIHFIYGGKISNYYDEHVLKAYVETFFCNDVLEGYNELFPGFRIKQSWDNQSYHRAIRKIPSFDTPSFFGLPNNIFRFVQIDLALSMMHKLQKLESKTLKGGYDLPMWHEVIESIIRHWKQIYHEIGNVEINDPTQVRSNDQFHHFVQTELLLAQHLVMTVSSSINLLQKAIDGAIELKSIRFQQLRDRLVEGQVPAAWKELWSGPTNVTTWMTEMTKKKASLDAYQESVDIFAPGHVLKLPEFFNTSALLCSLKQKVAKEKNYAMDDVIVFSQFESSHIEQNGIKGEMDHVSVSGLFLRGCSVDEQTDGYFIIQPVKTNMPDYQISPSIGVSFLQASSIFQVPTKFDTILIPVYSNVLSDKILFEVTVCCKKNTARSWILAGAALYLEC